MHLTAGSANVGDAVPLFEAHLLGGPANAPGSRHQYDVARDRQRFLLNVPLQDATDSITVVLNWAAGHKKQARSSPRSIPSTLGEISL